MKNKVQPLTLLNILVYFLASIALLHIMYYAFTDAISFFPNLDVLIPFILILLVPIEFFFSLNAVLAIEDKRKRYISIIVHAAICTLFALVSLIMLIVSIFTKYGGSAIANQFTSYFPIDFIIYSILILLLGSGFIFYGAKELKNLKTATADLTVTKSGWPLPEPKKGKYVYRAFTVIFILFAMYFFAQGFIGILTIDLMHPENLLGSIAIILLCLLPTLEIIVYYFGYLRVAENRKERFQIHHSLYIASLYLLLLILYFVQLAINPQFIVESLQTFFPVDFAASVNIGPMILLILSLVPIIYSITLLLIRIYSSKKNNK